jgi:hypothetical protein
MNRASFPSLMSNGKKKATKAVKKKVVKKKAKNNKEGVLMSEERKDVTVHVIGVAMTGGVKHDSKRPSSEDTKKIWRKNG